MNAIDTSRCPPDFRAAVAELADATAAVADYAIESRSWQNQVSEGAESFLRGFTMQDPFAVVRAGRDRRRQLQDRATRAVGEYQRAAARYKK